MIHLNEENGNLIISMQTRAQFAQTKKIPIAGFKRWNATDCFFYDNCDLTSVIQGDQCWRCTYFHHTRSRFVCLSCNFMCERENAIMERPDCKGKPQIHQLMFAQIDWDRQSSVWETKRKYLMHKIKSNT